MNGTLFAVIQETMDSSSEDEEQQNYFAKRYLTILLDCSPEMFGKTQEGCPFGMALKALFSLFSEQVPRYLKPCKQISVFLCHSNTEKQIFIDKNIPVVDAYKKLFKYSTMNDIEFQDEFSCNSTGNFSEHLLHVLKHLKKGDINTLFFITARSNPTMNQNDRFETLSHLKNFARMRIDFEVLPMQRELNMSDLFEEIYTMLGKACKNLYYKLEHLQEKLNDVTCSRVSVKTHKLFPYLGSTNSFKVESISAHKDFKLLPNCFVDKQRKEIVSNETVVDEDTEIKNYASYTVILPKAGSITKNLELSEYRLLRNSNIIPVGITMIEARKQKYSMDGFYNHPSHIVKAKEHYQQAFKQLWISMNELFILCYCKFNKVGIIKHMELQPAMIQNEMCFVMKFIPNRNYIFAPLNFKMGVKAEGEDLTESKETKEQRKAAISSLITEMTVSSEELLDNLLSKADKQKIEYLKTEMLGTEYKPNEIKDMSKWFDQRRDIKILCDELDNLSPLTSVPTKRRRRV